MKKLLIVFTILGSFVTSHSFSQDKTPMAVYASFKSTFNLANQVSWSKADNLYKANFSIEGQSMSAFYNADGILVASSRIVTILQLPITLQSSLRKDFADYKTSDFFEVDNNEGTAYYVRVENNKKKLQLKSTPYGEWNTYYKNESL